MNEDNELMGWQMFFTKVHTFVSKCVLIRSWKFSVSNTSTGILKSDWAFIALGFIIIFKQCGFFSWLCISLFSLIPLISLTPSAHPVYLLSACKSHVSYCSSRSLTSSRSPLVHSPLFNTITYMHNVNIIIRIHKWQRISSFCVSGSEWPCFI